MKKKAPKKEDIEQLKSQLRAFVNAAELDDVRLLGGMFYQNLRGGDLPDHLHTAIEAEGRLNEEHKSLFISAEIKLYGTYEGQEGDDTGVEITAQYGAHYTVDSRINLPEKFVKFFARTVSMLHIWPYWREYVQSTTGRMGLPPLTVPLYKAADVAKAIATDSAKLASVTKTAKEPRAVRRKAKSTARRKRSS